MRGWTWTTTHAIPATTSSTATSWASPRGEGTNDCVVLSGTLHDPYTGTTITFAKVHATAVQIDHMIPLKAVWDLGASRWTEQERVSYANDPAVLLAVSGSENESKGDRLADEWRPPNTADWCRYATQMVRVHAKYRLVVTPTERAALASMLHACH